MFTAYLMSAHGFNDPSRSGFQTEEAAWDYIRTRLCRTCKTDLEDGTEEPPSDTMCGAEWAVDPTVNTENAIPINAQGAPAAIEVNNRVYTADADGNWPELTTVFINHARCNTEHLSPEIEAFIRNARDFNIRVATRFMSMNHLNLRILTHENK